MGWAERKGVWGRNNEKKGRKKVEEDMVYSLTQVIE